LSKFAIIVAIDQKGGIGKDGDLAWKLSADLKYFKKTTIGAGNNAVIMGRKTWDSIPAKFRPLAGRLNVVISRQPDLPLPAGVKLANSLTSALELCQACEQSFVIGGGTIYAEALQHSDCNQVYLTAVHATFDCDTFFDADQNQWQLIEESEKFCESELEFSFCLYQRQIAAN